MLISTDGLILRNTKSSDFGSIVTIYTRSEGMLAFSFRQKSGKAGNRALLAPLTQVSLVADIRNNRKIHYTKELSLSYSYSNIPFDPTKGAVLLFLNELLLKVLKEEESNPPLFNFIIRALQELDSQQPLHPSYHLTVMIHLAHFLGFFPQRRSNDQHLYFDLREGLFVGPPFSHPEVLSPETSILMNELITIPFEEYQQFYTLRPQRNSLLDALISFYHLHIAGFGAMKSVDVLRSLFD